MGGLAVREYKHPFITRFLGLGRAMDSRQQAVRLPHRRRHSWSDSDGVDPPQLDCWCRCRAMRASRMLKAPRVGSNVDEDDGPVVSVLFLLGTVAMVSGSVLGVASLIVPDSRWQGLG